MSKRVTPEKLVDDLQVVVQDAEALLNATATQTGERIQEARTRTADSLRRIKARLGDADDYVRTKPWQVAGVAQASGSCSEY